MALVSVDDLVEYLGLSTLSTAASAAAGAILDGLEGEMETYLGRALEETTVEDEEVKVDRRGFIRFSRLPVRSVASISVDGDLLAATAYKVENWGVSDIFPGFLPSSLISPEPTISVSYVAGLPGEDPTSPFGKTARGVLKRAAARILNQTVRQDAAGLKALTVEGTALNFSYPDEGLTEGDKKAIQRHKRRVVRT